MNQLFKALDTFEQRYALPFALIAALAAIGHKFACSPHLF